MYQTYQFPTKKIHFNLMFQKSHLNDQKPENKSSDAIISKSVHNTCLVTHKSYTKYVIRKVFTGNTFFTRIWDLCLPQSTFKCHQLFKFTSVQFLDIKSRGAKTLYQNYIADILENSFYP